MSFGVDEPLLGLAKLLLEMTNLSMKRAQVFVGCEIQAARHLLHVLVDRAFDTAA